MGNRRRSTWSGRSWPRCSWSGSTARRSPSRGRMATAWLIEVGSGEHPLAVVDGGRHRGGPAPTRPLHVVAARSRRGRTDVPRGHRSGRGRPRWRPRRRPRRPGPFRRARGARGHRDRPGAGACAAASAWLAQDDPVVRTELSDAWRVALRSYVPEPFQHLG